ncbi:zinc finger-containing ubiquitin peptidase 1-like isoform X1 [Schistocerca gregaria]|uniref:zinc finger-containing ubiquitin peptidase 1-like isoform X1 n=1 Tax=Schistocerca gregaria TaxID=7010 RepID=UPI00211EFF2A|nr:zinc finger-containing ubiquitin peptidase 1-like isoform X1 [Schistocerca gregaria]XP_049853498.1 zinc finger-containing ubiquitin peptidase 1-like isoform X1 [Schistocerca gregaria]XP_049853499.1 zinc finger-containing ubiquitin peptidase 1-like isoform X1 [Schistocerca gregaria]XP_049853500.1 zinc finger-containing ubiquitin peptidase 1-like isoform X1 [Schistocerca gregaria]XP_049853501.1 zinc finger-containing ubiquitin peptidase 1-like isoform X1 [Schistocerca gregaria]
MASKMPEMTYSCEICGVEGLNEEEMRSHMVVYHLEGAVSCPFCDLGEVSAEQLLMHVNSAHLDYLTPEQELLAFIDDEDIDGRDDSCVPSRPLPWELYSEPGTDSASSCWENNINNNNNNNNNYCGAGRSTDPDPSHSTCTVASSSSVAGSGSPLRSQLALDLRASASPGPNPACKKSVQPQQCPMCSYTSLDPLQLEEHINRQHFDLTSPSFPPATPPGLEESVYSCPLCVRTFQNSPDLELHVNIEHKDILSPAKPQQPVNSVENWSDSCPVCCMTNFKSNQEMVAHIEEHFNNKGLSPITPDMSCDRMLAREIEKREREVRRLREQREFEMLRAQYGMDNQGNFREQSLTNMQKAVYAGEMSVSDYYERQIELRAAESNGVDDGSSCTKGLVPKIRGVSSSSANVIRTYMCTTVDHYASTYGDKGWGCGYRNMQMMLSSLLHHTGYNEQLYKPSLVGGGLYGLGNRSCGLEMPSRSAMPSISRLQQHIEWAWSQGFDLQGSEQLGGKLFNTRKWIGATEVVTVLSSLRIRCQLVDFHRPTSADGSHPELFGWVLEYFQKNEEFKPPLYLQHQGHSRTIVGVEQLKDGGINLLVFDPSHTPHQMAQFQNTSTAVSGMRLIRKSLASMKARQYQLVAVCGIMDTEHEYQQSKILRSVRVPQDR